MDEPRPAAHNGASAAQRGRPIIERNGPYRSIGRPGPIMPPAPGGPARTLRRLAQANRTNRTRHRSTCRSEPPPTRRSAHIAGTQRTRSTTLEHTRHQWRYGHHFRSHPANPRKPGAFGQPTGPRQTECPAALVQSRLLGLKQGKADADVRLSRWRRHRSPYSESATTMVPRSGKFVHSGKLNNMSKPINVPLRNAFE